MTGFAVPSREFAPLLPPLGGLERPQHVRMTVRPSVFPGGRTLFRARGLIRSRLNQRRDDGAVSEVDIGGPQQGRHPELVEPVDVGAARDQRAYELWEVAKDRPVEECQTHVVGFVHVGTATKEVLTISVSPWLTAANTGGTRTMPITLVFCVLRYWTENTLGSIC